MLEPKTNGEVRLGGETSLDLHCILPNAQIYCVTNVSSPKISRWVIPLPELQI
jgi:hypothetical protein